jgi:hypothetical protein
MLAIDEPKSGSWADRTSCFFGTSTIGCITLGP